MKRNLKLKNSQLKISKKVLGKKEITIVGVSMDQEIKMMMKKIKKLKIGNGLSKFWMKK